MDRNILLENMHLHDVNPLLCGEAYCEAGASVGPDVWDHHLIHFIFSGSGYYSSTTGVHRVEEGQMFIIRPGERVSYANDAGRPWHYVWIGFACCIALRSLLLEDVVTLPEAETFFLDIAAADNIIHGREMYVCARVYGLLGLLQARRGGEGQPSQRYVRMARNYIELHYAEVLRVDHIAAQLNIDRAYFSKLFHRCVGKSPQQYIIDFRLGKAAMLMTTQGISPGEAAEKVGYGDFSNFSRMFKQRYGMPPGVYRSKYGK